MIEAAAADQQAHPPWWDATIVSHELRAFDVAILRLAVTEPLPYRQGQTISVESAKAPRYWRFYSVANAPREDGTLDLHVAMIDGGMVSPVLARGLGVGSRLRLGPAVGVFGLTAEPQHDLLMVAGGTGLAPIKAIVEQLPELHHPPRVHLFFGARRAEEQVRPARSGEDGRPVAVADRRTGCFRRSVLRRRMREHRRRGDQERQLEPPRGVRGRPDGHGGDHRRPADLGRRAREQENLQGEITYLRMYSEVYRTHLRTYLEALLRNVDEWARAEQSPGGAEHDQPLA